MFWGNKEFKILTCVLAGVIALSLGAVLVYAEEGHEHAGERESDQVVDDVGICTVMKNPASAEYYYDYNGKTYYFCCPMCIEEFKKDPEKYASSIKEIQLEAYQFGYGPEQITVKKGDIVRIFATSRDVTHGFYIKEYNINTTIEKGKVEKIEFIADKSGEFDIICSVYCGKGHSDMRGKLVVEE